MNINKLINPLMQEAVHSNCSDIYFLPYGKSYRVSMHTHLGLEFYQKMNPESIRQIINYFKYHGHMQMSEQRRPMMGALKWCMNGQTYYLRLSTVANFNGMESLVIRIIYSFEQVPVTYLDSCQFDHLQQLSLKRGLMLFAGPTGSGKTTTIYHLARQFCQNQLVMTIEDPVEIVEDRFLQLQVNDEAQMDYQSLLKVGLRNRPDIFVIGEIRDAKTAQIAVQAALSGHLVFSTVHAKDAFGVLSRLIQLGVDRTQLQDSLNAVAYQRLIPTNNEQLASLFSIVTNEQLFNNNYSASTALNEWRQRLEDGFQSKQITEATKKRFWYG